VTVRVRTHSETVNAGTTRLVAANCAPGERATGGGANNVATPGLNIIQSAPEPFGAGATPTGWQVTYHNTTGSSRPVFVYAVCAA
jgi:hypothetical protein